MRCILKAALSSLLLLFATVSCSPARLQRDAALARRDPTPELDLLRRAGPLQSDNLRIEGASNTIFEGPIVSGPGNVTTPSGGKHPCLGTNGGANPNPGATPTTALQAASKIGHFAFDGTFDTDFDDFFITSIGSSTETATEFWGLLVNYQFTPVGGCQYETKAGDEILWAFNAFNAAHFLKLSGPSLWVAHKPFNLTVTDGSTGQPVSGATVGGQTTNDEGIATIPGQKVGWETYKASRSDSIRSNLHTVFIA